MSDIEWLVLPMYVTKDLKTERAVKPWGIEYTSLRLLNMPLAFRPPLMFDGGGIPWRW
jgi:hypothetical protein